jgi:predicted nuclease of predicted toxin-antitoxin system
MRILADENIQEPTLRFLRELGHDVLGVHEAGLKSAPDADVFRQAQQEQRVVLTYNCDFADIRDLTGKDHNGVIRLRIENQRIGYAHPLLKEALEKLRGLNLRNHLVTVMDDRLRIRKTS